MFTRDLFSASLGDVSGALFADFGSGFGLAWHSRTNFLSNFGGCGGVGVLIDTEDMEDISLFTLSECSGDGVSSHFLTTNLGGFK